MLCKERVRQNKMRNERFTQVNVVMESDKKRAGDLENLLKDKWNDLKFRGINYQIISKIDTKKEYKLKKLGAKSWGLSRYLNK